MEASSEGFDAPEGAEIGKALEHFRPRLERLLDLRLDQRLRRRVDPGDVLQETFVEVVRRLEEFRARRPMPFFLWVRLQAIQTLARTHERHLASARRSAEREVTPRSLTAASTVSLARAFAHPGRSPSDEVARAEFLERLQAVLERMSQLDREVLALRYFERLSNEETAVVLGLTPSGATKRHLRALGKLRSAFPNIEDVPTPQ